MAHDFKKIAARNPGIDWESIKKAEEFLAEMEAAGVGIRQAPYSLDPPFSGGPTEQQKQRAKLSLLNLSTKR